MDTLQLPRELEQVVADAARRLAEGGLVVYPTETFYGLGAALSRPEAMARLAAVKGREGSKPVPLIAGSTEEAVALFSHIPDLARVLMHRFWPGPMTLVLPAKAGLPFEVAPRGEVGVRVSSHPVARELARRVGPIASTSANVAGGREVTRASRIDPTLASAVDLVVEAGETPGGLASTVVAFRDGVPVLLREGAIQRALIDACMP